jgi:hypothetical protein
LASAIWPQTDEKWTTDADTTVAHYEHLRRHAVSGRISGVRHGLPLMLQKGMAAWLEQLSLVQTPCVGYHSRPPHDRLGFRQEQALNIRERPGKSLSC